TKARTCISPHDRLIGGNTTDIHISLHPDFIFREHSVKVVDAVVHVLTELKDLLKPPVGSILCHAPHARESHGQSRPTEFFKKIVNSFAVLKEMEKSGDRSKVH